MEENDKIALLLTVGDVAGLPKAISDTKADLVYFIHTKKSLKTIEDVIIELNQKPFRAKNRTPVNRYTNDNRYPVGEGLDPSRGCNVES